MPEILNALVDVSEAFRRQDHDWFLPARAARFDAVKRTGAIRWEKHQLRPGVDFRHGGLFLQRDPSSTFRGPYYGDETLPFAVSFPSPRTVRLRVSARGALRDTRDSLMLTGLVPEDRSWKVKRTQGGAEYRGPHGAVTVSTDPWRVEVRDAAGKVLTGTRALGDAMCFMNYDPTPFAFVRRGGDHQRHMAASFTLASDEKIFGTGESFTRLDKRGQAVTLWAHDAQGVQNRRMYKPVPFFLSSAGYGMFVHATTPMTFDFGHTYDETNTIYLGDDELDLFIFLGDPKEVLTAYTALTGRPQVPPTWSFGLWMSRITYKSEAETRAVAQGLRRHRIPCDVIHLDTGWFEQDWRCDYRFAPSRFKNATTMLKDLKRDGFRICLWQLPYFTHDNALYPELARKGLLVPHADGGAETQEAALDFSNPKTARWYQDRLA